MGCCAMRNISFVWALALSMGLVVGLGCVAAQNGVSDEFPVPTNVEFLSGSSWRQGGVTVRLYGIESCPRGELIALDGQTADCGEVSMVFLAGLVELGKPTCQGIHQTVEPEQYIAICKITIDGNLLDLGLSMILSGYATAAYDEGGQAISADYAHGESQAKSQKQGLWAFSSITNK